MPRLEFHPEKIPDMQAFLKLCPFGALSEKDGKVEASAACKMCRLCVKKGPEGAALYIEDEKKCLTSCVIREYQIKMTDTPLHIRMAKM